jgi:hypothetical protein
MSRGTTLAIVLGLFVLACICTLALIGLGGLFFWLVGFRRVVTAPPTLIPLAPTLTPFVPSTVSDPNAEMDSIEKQVMELRGLTADKSVERNFMTPGELRDYTVQDFEKDYSRDEAADDTRVLAAFGLLDSDFELYDFYIDLYSENILGFYDNDTGQLFIISKSGQMGAVERSTFSHEFQHALQDQLYGLEALGWNDEAIERDAQKFAALQALVEGDATTLESQWQARHFTQPDWDQYNAEAYADPNSAFFRAPAYMQKDFYFPYVQGADFVNQLYQRGGWSEVDAAYKNLPVSTEMILHLDKYDANEIPEEVPSPTFVASLGGDWREIDSNVMGEWYVSLILEQQIEEGEAATAAAGWGGDHYAAAYNEKTDQTAVAWRIVWDTTGDAEEFVDAFKNYGDQRFEGEAVVGDGRLCWLDGRTCLYFAPDAALWVYAPEADTLEKIKQAVEF